MKRKYIIDNLKHEVNRRQRQADNAARDGAYNFAQIIKNEISGLMVAIIMLEDGER